MNRGTCFSQESLDRRLIIGGSIGGVFLLCCFGSICWGIRSAHIKEREAEKAGKILWSLHLRTPLQVIAPPSFITQTTPISFSNPIPMHPISSVNVASQPTNSTVVPAQTSSTHGSPEYQQIMKYLATTDTLLQQNTTNTETANHAQS